MIPQTRLLNLLNLINELKLKRLSIDDISLYCSVSKRTAYRYIKLLEKSNLPVEQEFFTNKFFITV